MSHSWHWQHMYSQLYPIALYLLDSLPDCARRTLCATEMEASPWKARGNGGSWCCTYGMQLWNCIAGGVRYCNEVTALHLLANAPSNTWSSTLHGENQPSSII